MAFPLSTPLLCKEKVTMVAVILILILLAWLLIDEALRSRES